MVEFTVCLYSTRHFRVVVVVVVVDAYFRPTYSRDERAGERESERERIIIH